MPMNNTQPNVLWSHHTCPEHELLDSPAKASPVPAPPGAAGTAAWGGTRAGGRAFHRAMNEDAQKVGDEGEPGIVGVCDSWERSSELETLHQTQTRNVVTVTVRAMRGSC